MRRSCRPTPCCRVPTGRCWSAPRPTAASTASTARARRREWFDPEEKYIWALTADDAGRVYVATGDPKGRVYRVAADGTGAPLLHVERRARRLDGPRPRAPAGGRHRVAGTGLPARRRGPALPAARHQPAGGASAASRQPRPPLRGGAGPPRRRYGRRRRRHADAARAAACRAGADGDHRDYGDVGGRHAAGRFRAGRPGGRRPSRPPDRSSASTSMAPGTSCGNRARTRPTTSPSRTPAICWSPPATRASCTGSAAIRCGPAWSAGSAASRPCSCCATGGRALVATSNGGALVRVDGGHADRGTYVSEVRDARSVSAWGVAVVAGDGAGRGIGRRSRRAAATRRRRTRRGARGVAPYKDADGLADRQPERPLSPVAGVQLAGKGDGPVVTSINAAYLQRNQRPTVSGLVVHPPGVVFQKPFSTGETEIAGYQSDVLERRLANQGQPAPADRHADARSAHLPERAADAGLEGRRRQRRRPHVRRVLPPRRRQVPGPALASGLADPILRLGHDRGAQRHLRGANRRQRLSVTSGRQRAGRRAGVVGHRGGQHPAGGDRRDRSARTPAGWPSPSRSATTSRRSRGSSTRSTAGRGCRPIRRTACSMAAASR